MKVAKTESTMRQYAFALCAAVLMLVTHSVLADNEKTACQIDAEEYSVIIAVLDHFIPLKQDSVDRLLMEFTVGFKVDSILGIGRGADSSVDEYTISDFDQKNVRGCKIDSQQVNAANISILTQETRQSIRNQSKGNFWQRFFELYPNSGGYVEVSRVGFDQNKTIALVRVMRLCGGTCGSVEFVILKKSVNRWRVIQQFVELQY